MTAPYPIGVLGGGRVGQHLAVELGRLGTRVLMFDERKERLTSFLAEAGPAGEVAVASSLRELVEHLEPPRRILLSLAEDEPAFELLDALTAMIEPSDVVADLSHSYFKKTERREALMARPGARYLDVGACAASAGAGPLRYVFHVGGHRVAFEIVRSILEKLAPSVDGPAVAYLGPAGAGHMVANVAESIELAFQKALLELALVESTGTGLPLPPAQTGDRLRMQEAVRRVARTALDFSVFAPTLSAGILVGVSRPTESWRRRPDLPPPLPAAPPAGWTESDPAVAATVVSASVVSQGFNLISAVAEQLDYGTRLSDVSRVWRGIAGFDRDVLDVVTAGLRGAHSPSPVGEEVLHSFIESRLPALRRVVARCALSGVPVPVFSSALTYLEQTA